MAQIGYFLSSEEHGPERLVPYARMGEEAGLGPVLILGPFPSVDREPGAGPICTECHRGRR